VALTEPQKALIRLYTGWGARFGQFYSRLEQALSAIAVEPDMEALITNPIGGSPPGLLALIQDVDAKLTAAHGRLKASVVGSITLNPAELMVLRSEGRRHVARLCSILGVEVQHDVFSSAPRTTHATFGGPSGGGGYVGK
jgi:hypothetical protein